jgi:hypothetical protein
MGDIYFLGENQGTKFDIYHAEGSQNIFLCTLILDL